MMTKFISNILIVFIRTYQYLISPLFPPACRHEPSCSRYALEAIKLHGPFHGFKLAVKRIIHCHPWGRWGYDPVPQKQGKNNRNNKCH